LKPVHSWEKVIRLEDKMKPIAIALLAFLILNKGLIYASEVSRKPAVTVIHEGNEWSYSVTNHSSYPITIFSLWIDVPFTVRRSPKGWGYEKDCSAHWSSKGSNADKKNKEDINPGASLSGFVIRSKVKTSKLGKYSLQTWDAKSMAAGETFAGMIEIPGALDDRPCGID
jgi:hypothetical protein